jgi:hypothetical protein
MFSCVRTCGFCQQSSFLVKRESGRIQFSAEKYNLTAKNAFKYQGIANGKAVDISQYYADTDKEKKNPKGITLSTKSPKGINAPVRVLSCVHATVSS